MARILSVFPLLGLLLFVPMSVFAASGWTGYSKVVELTPTSQHRYLVKLKVSENPSGCKNKETFFQDYDLTGSGKMFSTLLEAVTSGQKVRVYVTGKCELSGYSEMSSVSIVP